MKGETLNGVGANTGNGLLHLKQKNCVKPFLKPYRAYQCKKESINTNITPSEGSRIDSLKYCNSVTQDRVRELLGRRQFGNEGTRIATLQPTESLLNRPIILPGCPPLPPPPAPPARACVLTKNQK